MFARFFARKTVSVRPASVVRVLDGEFIIVVRENADGTIDYRYENDRTNTVYNTLADFCR